MGLGTFLKFGPQGNPMRVMRTLSTDKREIGIPNGYHLTWEKKVLPDAIGAGSYAWETYGQPAYPRYGNGNINVTNPLRETSPASYVFQSVGIVGIPPAGILQGQFVTQPLMDPTEAERRGVVLAPTRQSPNAVVLSP